MAKWGWYSMMAKLANDDILKFNDIGKMNFISCLNFLAYQKTKENYIKIMEERKNK